VFETLVADQATTKPRAAQATALKHTTINLKLLNMPAYTCLKLMKVDWFWSHHLQTHPASRTARIKVCACGMNAVLYHFPE
jgi:hypothetical protein